MVVFPETSPQLVSSPPCFPLAHTPCDHSHYVPCRAQPAISLSGPPQALPFGLMVSPWSVDCGQAAALVALRAPLAHEVSANAEWPCGWSHISQRRTFSGGRFASCHKGPLKVAPGTQHRPALQVRPALPPDEAGRGSIGFLATAMSSCPC